LAALRSGDFASVERACNGLIALDRNHPGAWFIGAVCALEGGQPAEAVSGFETATTLAPERADYWTQFARCQAQLGRQADALASVRRAESLPIGEALTHDTLANVLTRLGRHADAVPHFEKAAETTG
jgi:tetratricopeptide (TPR) repeat protein